MIGRSSLKIRKNGLAKIGSIVVNKRKQLLIVKEIALCSFTLVTSTGAEMRAEPDDLRLATCAERLHFVSCIGRRPCNLDQPIRTKEFHDKISEEPRSVHRYHTNNTRFSRK